MDFWKSWCYLQKFLNLQMRLVLIGVCFSHVQSPFIYQSGRPRFCH